LTTENNLPFKGLSSEEVRSKQKSGESNKTEEKEVKPFIEILLENGFSVFNIINIFIIGVLLYFGFTNNDNRLFLDSVGIFTVTFFNTALSIYQEYKTTRLLAKTNILKRNKVGVIRDGRLINIDRKEIVTGDIIYIKKGEQIVVDGKVLESNHLEIDESLITGEPVLQEKSINENLISGSFCMYGTGFYEAINVGEKSYANKLIKDVKKIKIKNSPLLKKINFFFVLFFAITIVLVLLESLISYNNSSLNPDRIRQISAIAISIIPEGLIFFATITFLIGVYRISKSGAIIQKINSIDAFSSLNTICLDKTGTITNNEIKISQIVRTTEVESNGDIKKLLGTYAKLISDEDNVIKTLKELDSFENAVKIKELPFRSEIKMSFLQFRTEHGLYTLVLGAYENILKNLTFDKRKIVSDIYRDSNCEGYRNLLLGKINIQRNERLENYKNYVIYPLCIVSFSEQIKQGINEVFNLFNEKNVEVKILSGDSKTSIKKILSETDYPLYFGNKTFEASEGIQNDEISEKYDIFSRLTPDDKLEIVKELKKKGKITGFMGDGINDVKAIKESDFSIAMESGSTITKEISDIVLKEDNIKSLPQIFNEGNKIINTVTAVTKLIVAKNLILIVLFILSGFSLLDFTISPRGSSLLNVLSTGLPAHFIAARNNNISKPKNFFSQIFLFVIPYLIVSFGIIYFFGNFFFPGGGDVSSSDKIITFLALSFIVNFLIGITFEDRSNYLYYSGFSVILILLYFILSVNELDGNPLGILKIFYEIKTISVIDFASIFVLALTNGLLQIIFRQFLNFFISQQSRRD